MARDLEWKFVINLKLFVSDKGDRSFVNKV